MNDVAQEIKDSVKADAKVCHNALKLYLSFKEMGFFPKGLIKELGRVVNLKTEDEGWGFIRVNFGSVFAYYDLQIGDFVYEVNPQGCGGTEVIVQRKFKKFLKQIDNMSDELIHREFFEKCDLY